MSAEANFWSFVAAERRAAVEAEQPAEVPTLLEYLEREASIARETAFSLDIRGEKVSAAYWTGYSDALEDLLKKIEMQEVRV